MKNGKAAGAPGLVSKKNKKKSADEAGFDGITDHINLIIVNGVTPAKQDLTAINNYSKQKGDA